MNTYCVRHCVCPHLHDLTQPSRRGHTVSEPRQPFPAALGVPWRVELYWDHASHVLKVRNWGRLSESLHFTGQGHKWRENCSRSCIQAGHQGLVVMPLARGTRSPKKRGLGTGPLGCPLALYGGCQRRGSPAPWRSVCNVYRKLLPEETVQGGISSTGDFIPNNHYVSEKFTLCGAKHSPRGDGTSQS